MGRVGALVASQERQVKKERFDRGWRDKSTMACHLILEWRGMIDRSLHTHGLDKLLRADLD